MRNVGKIFFALVVVGVATWRFQLIVWAIESIGLSVVCIFIGSAGYVFGSIERIGAYWIAAGAFVVLLVSAAWILYRLFNAGRLSEENNRSRSGGFQLPLRMLFMFVLIIPILAPFNPAEQGDLSSARLLPPLTGNRIQLASIETGDLGVERLLRSINERIVHQHSAVYGPDFQREVPELNVSTSRSFFLLGTDDLGRDVFSRLLYAIRESLVIGAAAVSLTLFLGVAIGLTAGLGGRIADALLMRLTDVFLAVPALILLLMLVAFFGNSPLLLVTTLALTGWMNIARVVRAETLNARTREYIFISKMLGKTPYQIVRLHILPNLYPTIRSAALLQFCSVLLAEAALSFLGVGIQPPTPSLGNMINESLPYLTQAWWMSVLPGVVLTGIIIAANAYSEKHFRHPG
ncbi:MAG TPA: ABC transporter permease [Bacteroidota bacterium]|nr:ABC transporter permease [Bacteroidota bacterium]